MNSNSTPSNNGRGSDAWSGSWTHFGVDRRSPSFCRVTFDHPPINTITRRPSRSSPSSSALIEQDRDLNVVVFDSANPDFYLAHYDTEHDPAKTAALGVGPTGMHAWLDLLVRLARAPVVSIASIRGRARGAGQRVRARLRPAVRVAREHVARAVRGRHRGRSRGRSDGAARRGWSGRGRALEILLVADDLDGRGAEHYGYVNRLIADDRLDARDRRRSPTSRALRPRRDRGARRPTSTR